MITFKNVTKRYNDQIGLKNVNINIDKGEFVFVVGPSGAGKSTFISLILKQIDADEGSIKVGSYDVTSMSGREIPKYRRNVGMVFQDFRLLQKKTVFENVAFAMEVVYRGRNSIRKKVPQILSLVGISDMANKYPDELSAGEQQRVAIARAIVNSPAVLIADEPTGNLDPDTAMEIMDLLEQINLTGTTVVMVTHAKDIVDSMDKRVIAIEDGEIVSDQVGTYDYYEGAEDEYSLSDMYYNPYYDEKTVDSEGHTEKDMSNDEIEQLNDASETNEAEDDTYAEDERSNRNDASDQISDGEDSTEEICEEQSSQELDGGLKSENDDESNMSMDDNELREQVSTTEDEETIEGGATDDK